MAKKNDATTLISVIAKSQIFVKDDELFVKPGEEFLTSPDKAQKLVELGLVEYKAEATKIEFNKEI